MDARNAISRRGKGSSLNDFPIELDIILRAPSSVEGGFCGSLSEIVSDRVELSTMGFGVSGGCQCLIFDGDINKLRPYPPT